MGSIHVLMLDSAGMFDAGDIVTVGGSEVMQSQPTDAICDVFPDIAAGGH